MSRLTKSFIGALIGGAMAGGWLIVDLLLPEPIGDYLLFILMGVANAGIGWQVGRLVGKRREEAAVEVKGSNSKLSPDTE